MVGNESSFFSFLIFFASVSNRFEFPAAVPVIAVFLKFGGP